MNRKYTKLLISNKIGFYSEGPIDSWRGFLARNN